jgi:cytochrome b subunit of formate dehydrogenase
MFSSKQKFCLGFVGLWLAVSVAGDALAAGAGGLGNTACLSCHDGKSGKLDVPGKDGEKRTLQAVEPTQFAKSVHSGMECVTCHLEINDSTVNHKKTPGETSPDCVKCHEKLNIAAAQEKVAGERRWMRAVARNIETYKSSQHARPNADDPSKPNASCNDCHNVHSFNVPPRGTRERTAWHLGVSDLCGKCHEDQLKTWSESVHGKAIKQKHDPKAADCADCHTAHNVKKTSSDKSKLAITANCGSCHERAYATYKGTYHGQITTLGYAYTAKCFDCHGSHDIAKISDPTSKMHLDNRLETCQECHSGKKKIPLATAGFVSFSPHGTSDDLSKYPQIWVANKIMIQLLLGTFGFFWLHTLLWFYREFKERQQRKSQPHVKLEGLPEIPAKFQGKHFQRFSRIWRIAHLTFALSLMTLTLTGIPLFYPQSPWSQPLMTLLNGPQTAGLIHRVAAVIFAGVFFWHLVYMVVRVGRDWQNFKFFGPNSMVPGLQDLKGIIAMFKWFFGRAPRPIFDRWTYWEKFDYWAPFWGVTIIGASGITMWFPHIVAKFLPGWVFNVAAIFHSEEAFLAVVFLFTVHFFNNHFRPDKFPLDRVMFTGTVTLEELRHEHPLQYQRLLEAGELEQHLVEAPSSAFVGASTVLGFILIVAGLTLLTLVGIGFFTSAH